MSELEDLFAEARRAAPFPSEGLMARVMADADALQPMPRGFDLPAPAAPGFWSQLGSLFGGFGLTLAGLGTAAVAGLLIGYMQPAPVAALSEALLDSGTLDSVELFPTLPAALTGE